MLLSFNRARLMVKDFDFEVFKNYFVSNYKEIQATTYKLYDPLFQDNCRKK